MASPIFFISSLLSGFLRTEGNSKKAMYILAFAAILNITLDPLFIYVLNMGIFGAALTTIIATLISLIPAVYWYIIKKDTYLKISRPSFEKKIAYGILRVGAPAALEMVVIPLFSLVMTALLIGIGGAAATATYSSGWRLLSFIIIPAVAIGNALVPICAAQYGG